MSEKELIQKCLDNDVRAQRMLYDQFVGMSMGVCMRYSNSETDAEDILQTGFIKVFKTWILSQERVHLEVGLEE